MGWLEVGVTKKAGSTPLWKPENANKMSGPSTLNTDMHYVPQCLLRGFEISPGSDQVFAFAKADDRTFPVGIRNVACERDFYTIEDSDALDQVMNRADGQLANLLRSIREKETIFWLSPEERTMLAGFTILQSARTRAKLEQWKSIGKSFLEVAEKKGWRFEDPSKFQMEPEEERNGFLSSIVPLTIECLPYLLDKRMLLYKADAKLPFWISDNPVALANTVNPGDGIRGTLGFTVPGIEVYLPVSSRLTLAFLCPSILEGFEVRCENVKRLGFIDWRSQNFLNGARRGLPVQLSRDETLYQNSLQVANAERFVFSCQNEYSEAANMLKNAPELRSGPRVIAQ